MDAGGGERAKPLIDATNDAARVRAVSDQERKGKSSKHDEDEREEHSHEASEDASDKAEETESDEDSDETSEETESDEGEESEGEEGEENASAQRVAAALGVGSAEGVVEGEAGEGDEPAAVPNRSARRAEAAQRRKKRKTGTDGAEAGAQKSIDDGDDADVALPRDKNARAKELLKRRRDQASGASEGGTRPIQLLPGEMVDDALARSSSAVSKWIRDNFGIIQWVILGSLAAGGAFLFYQSRVDTTVADASAELMTGVRADRGRILPEDKRSDEEKEADPTRVYKTADERSDAALAGYKKVLADHGGTHTATLARLGEAGDYLDKRDWDHALESYSAVSSSTLAGADADVKARALEGIGFAKEGKGDLDGALASFKELEVVDGRGNKELGLYHQGRIWLGRGDKDKAKDFLKQAHDKLEQPSSEGQALRYLQQMTDESLRRIDPSLVPEKPPVIGGPKGGSMSPDELDKLRRKYEEMMKKAGDHH